jgi:HAD superfamily hydrolase (TIGR01509 family)
LALNPLEPVPRAVLFDLDDTLCDYAAARDARLRKAFSLASNGSFQPRDKIDLDQMVADSISMHPHGSDHFEELFARYEIDDPIEARAAMNWYRSNRFHGLRLFPEAGDVFRAARNAVARNVPAATRPIGVVTNGPAEVQRAKIELLSVDRFVDFTIISEEFGVAKPDPRIFVEALRLAGVPSDEAVFVGDSPEFDMLGAREANIPTVWINRHGLPWPDLGPPPARQIRSLGELPELLRSNS